MMPEKNTFTITAIVHIIEARDIVGKDWNNLSDPFVRILLCNERKETGIRHATTTALWDEQFVFKDVRLSRDQYESEHIYIQVRIYFLHIM